MPTNRALGALWHHRKAPMKEDAALMNAKAEIQLNEPDHGWHMFGCYKDWPTAMQCLRPLKTQDRHLFELIVNQKPCKPHADFDRKAGLPKGWTVESFMARVTSTIINIFKGDYGLTILPSDFCWTLSPNQTKFSMHLVISTHSPQYVFATNLWDGAWHLARRIVELDEEMREVVDLGIYTKERAMRMLGSSKFDKKQSVLEALDPSQAVRDHVITWLDDDTQVIPVPEQVPVALKRRAKPKTVYDLSKAAREDPSVLSLRMLELFQEKVHASGYIWSAGDFDPLNPGVGVRLNYTDRTEKCYTGNVHSGNQNLRAWVEGEEILLKCWSDRCSSAPPYRLGPVAPIPTTYLEQAVHVNMKYLTRDEHVATAGTIDNLFQRREEDVYKLNQVIEDWRNGDFAALNIKAPMGEWKCHL